MSLKKKCNGINNVYKNLPECLTIKVHFDVKKS